ncbi:MAG: tetratricopeptide repeat protein, partial [Bacteroidia bacterium]|nr:tetratricopeptide repeat protein [Bacteroidia bacterium]
MGKVVTLIICFSIVFSLNGRTKLDSLLADIKNNPSDTSKSISCSLAAFEYILANKGDSAVSIAAKGFEIAKRKNFLKGMAKCLVNEGIGYTVKNDAAKAKDFFHHAEEIWFKLLKSSNKKDQYFANVGLGSLYNNFAIQYSNNGDLHEALLYYNKSLQHRKLAADKAAIANSCNNISVIHADLGNISVAIEFCFQALKIYEELKDSLRIGRVFGNLGLYSESLNEYGSSLDYTAKALQIGRRFGNSALVGSSLNNMGSVYLKTARAKEAIECFNEALEIYKKIGNIMEQSNIISNLGSLYLRTGDKKSAYKHLMNSLPLKREIEDKAGESIALGNIAEYFFESKDYKRCVAYADSALMVAVPLGSIEDMKDFHKTLSKAWSKMADYDKALFHYEQHILLRDSVMKEENKKAGIKKQL